MSEASDATASSMRRFTSRTTGASKAMSRSWVMSSSASVAVAVRSAPDALHDFLKRRGGAVRALDGFENRSPRRHTAHVSAEGLAQLVHEERVARIGGRDRDRGALHGDGAGHVLAQILRRQRLDEGRRRRHVLRGKGRKPVTLGQSIDPQDVQQILLLLIV